MALTTHSHLVLRLKKKSSAITLPNLSAFMAGYGVNFTFVFDVHGSIHIGNVYVQLKVQLDVLFMYSLFLSIF
jgi:hypothetical protein